MPMTLFDGQPCESDDLSQKVVLPESRVLDNAIRFASASRPELTAYLRMPQGPTPTRRVLVSIHGISRNTIEHLELLGPVADQYGVALIVPEFIAHRFPDYQRLGRKGFGPRADLALIRLLNEISHRTGLDTGKVDLFGYSGGAQFSHRFAFVHPQRIRRLALGAAGWYTMPDDSIPYPLGTQDSGTLDAVRFHTLTATRLRTLVMVGEFDVHEEDLNTQRTIVAIQGPHRVSRAIRWQQAMATYAQRYGEDCGVDLVELAGVGHSFRDSVIEGDMANSLFAHLYEDTNQEKDACTGNP